jgi:glyoxylase-like metal-dependent hydrolase (beta-lactamase superfamily II)
MAAPDYLDVRYQDQPRLIATGLMETPGGLVLVDPGPTTALDGLTAALAERGATLSDVRAVLLTHIHLDHAGATGTLVDRAPDTEVFVHERGAPHVVDPRRLVRSARRIYGDQMDALWGEVQPVPDEKVHVVTDGDRVRLGERTLEVAYTPGHAQHHVSYLDPATGTAFVGDVGGMRVTGVDYTVPVTPPPDVDLAAWHESLNTVRAWAPEHLLLTHFGPVADVDAHLDTVAERLDAFAAEVRYALEQADAAEEEVSDEALADRFHEAEMERMRQQVPAADQPPYEAFAQPRESWYGLARFWRTQDA